MYTPLACLYGQPARLDPPLADPYDQWERPNQSPALVYESSDMAFIVWSVLHACSSCLYA